jgi:hypothetical protein
MLGLAMPAQAQDAESDGMGQGIDLLGQGMRMILEGMADEMRPMLDEMQPFLEEEVLPLMQRLGTLVDDLALYELPERLPNGDILIRRRPDAPPFEPPADPEAAPTDPETPEVGPGGDVEL